MRSWNGRHLLWILAVWGLLQYLSPDQCVGHPGHYIDEIPDDMPLEEMVKAPLGGDHLKKHFLERGSDARRFLMGKLDSGDPHYRWRDLMFLVTTPGDNELIPIFAEWIDEGNASVVDRVAFIDSPEATIYLASLLVPDASYMLIVGVKYAIEGMKHRRLALEKLKEFRDACDPNDTEQHYHIKEFDKLIKDIHEEIALQPELPPDDYPDLWRQNATPAQAAATAVSEDGEVSSMASWITWIFGAIAVAGLAYGLLAFRRKP